MSYDVLPEVRCQCGHLATDHLWAGKDKIKRCQRKKCHCLKFKEAQATARDLAPVPYPGWCRQPAQCQGKVSCPLDPTCAD